MGLTRVLFVCIGNACRSQMAEAFANRYGSDVLVASSAGLHPCEMVAPATVRLMLEKNIDLSSSLPKGLEETGFDFELIINMSGWPMPNPPRSPLREWKVDDPICFTDDRHREVRDHVETLVQRLIIELRKKKDGRGDDSTAAARPDSTRVV